MIENTVLWKFIVETGIVGLSVLCLGGLGFGALLVIAVLNWKGGEA